MKHPSFSCCSEMRLYRSFFFFTGLSLSFADQSLTLTNLLKVKKGLESLSFCPAEKVPIQRRHDGIVTGPTALPLVSEDRYLMIIIYFNV